MDDSQLTQLTANIVTAYVANHRATPQEVGELIENVGRTLWEAVNPSPQVEPEVRAKRKYTRRQNGQVVGAETTNSSEIIDEEEANEALIDDAIEASDSDGDITAWQVDENTGAKKAPEPMFD